MVIMMGNMKTCQSSFNSFLFVSNWQFTFDGGGGSSIRTGKSYWIKIRYWNSFFPQFFSRVFLAMYQTIFKFNEWKLIIENTERLMKRALRETSRVSTTFYIFTNADNILSFSLLQRMLFNYFPFVCEINNISEAFFYWCRMFMNRKGGKSKEKFFSFRLMQVNRLDNASRGTQLEFVY